MSALDTTAVSVRQLSWGAPEVAEQVHAPDHADAVDLAVDIERALAGLGEVERRVLNAYYGLGSTAPIEVAAIARSLKTTTAQVHATRVRAERALAGVLGGQR